MPISDKFPSKRPDENQATPGRDSAALGRDSAASGLPRMFTRAILSEICRFQALFL